MISISSNFDGGNIRVVMASDPGDLRLEIRADSNSTFFQWFHFRLTGARGVPCVMKIINAGAASYPEGWRDYRAVASADRQTWRRVPTTFDGQMLVITDTPATDDVYYAYFAPYSMQRHADLVAFCAQSPYARVEVLGQTLDGQDIDLVTIGDGDRAGRRVCWTIGRQHPGETMAEWWMEGFLGRLLDPQDSVARALRKQAVFHVVPNMNPDGSRRGNLRTNGAGANLNREWLEPSLSRSPEVHCVRGRMATTGVDFCLDVHGDEGLPYNFIAGADGIPGLTQRQSDLLVAYRAALQRACPDFQTVRGYPPTKPGAANLTICTSYVAQTFGCLAMTLEQPFKDNADAPDPQEGWSPGRARRLGAASLDALLAVVGDLR